MHAYQRTAALKAAIELDLFTAIGETTGTLTELVRRLEASERGVRVLCDYLVVMGFLHKNLDEPEFRYGLTSDSAAFLDKRSPKYVGSSTIFLASPFFTHAFRDLATVVRSGSPIPDSPSIEQELPIWVDFARGMGPIMYPIAEQVAKLLGDMVDAKILDVASGHGLFGIAVAKQNPTATIVALDFPSVLAVAKDNARRFGVGEQYSLLPGDALVVPFGAGFEAILVPNLLHHWDRSTIQDFLQKAYFALKPGGRIVVVEFAPNDDRVSPPIPASFALIMLANTSGGDAYTSSELVAMLQDAGFKHCESKTLLPSPQSVIVAVKK